MQGVNGILHNKPVEPHPPSAALEIFAVREALHFEPNYANFGEEDDAQNALSF